MLELLVHSCVSRDRCHDNAAAKLAKRSFLELDINIPTDTKLHFSWFVDLSLQKYPRLYWKARSFLVCFKFSNSTNLTVIVFNCVFQQQPQNILMKDILDVIRKKR